MGRRITFASHRPWPWWRSRVTLWPHTGPMAESCVWGEPRGLGTRFRSVWVSYRDRLAPRQLVHLQGAPAPRAKGRGEPHSVGDAPGLERARQDPGTLGRR